jgi:hypothetical protein
MNELTIYQKLAETAFKNFYNTPLQSRPSADDTSHVLNIARSIMMHRDKIMPGGGFVTAVIENNLDGAINRADSVCSQNLAFFVHCKLHIHP